MYYVNTMIQEGDLVFLYKDERRNYLIKIQGGRLHTDLGYLELKSIAGKEFGEKIETNLGHAFFILRPYLYEMVMKIKRQTQILYPKDIGTIITRTNIFPGARVIECGAGSGSLTTALANFVRPGGKVYSYDRNEEFLENAKKNIEKYGLSAWVEFKLREVIDAFDEKDVDFVMIDIGSQWDLIDAAYKSLKGGSRLATICPTFEQLTKTVFTLEEKGFTNIESLEVLARKILVRKGKTRPEQKMPSHTGWLVFASKITL
jgi:tRNA (adenine57-N1/adenine58-N1)-methyltransferase